jgi:RND family efflux transporter MFP subunit
MRPLPLALCLAALAVACGGNEYVEPPPPAVTVAPPEVRDVVDWLEFTGTTEAINTVEIRARVQGFLQQVEFEEGAVVAEGDLLYVIEPEEYEARVARAEASVKVARTGKALAEATLARMEQAFETRAVSELDVIESRAKADAAAAEVDSAEAELLKARLDLSYTRIYAPIAGRVGRNRVDPGNLVGAGEKTLLNTIIQYDPIHAVFDMSERDLLAVLGSTTAERAAEGTGRAGRTIPLELGRANDPDFPFAGVVDFSDQEVDPETGTFLMRGVFPNPEPILLLPGLFVRLRLPLDTIEGALLVPERALGSDQSGRFLLVVNGENVVEHRPVQIGAQVGDMRAIRSGIEAGDQVVVDGLLRARPGAKVVPQRGNGAPPAPAAASAGSGESAPDAAPTPAGESAPTAEPTGAAEAG